METSIPDTLHQEWSPSQPDLQLNGKTIAVILVAMRHRDYVYKIAHSLGAKLVFVDCQLDDWAKPFAHDFIQMQCSSATNPNEIITLLDTYIAQKRVELNDEKWMFDGICSFDEYSIVSANEIAHHYKLPGIPPNTVSKVKHKHRLRIESENAGIWVPKSKMLPMVPLLKDDYKDELTTKWTFPIVLKPVAGASSNFVRKVDSYDELYHIVKEYYNESVRSGVQKFWSVGNQDQELDQDDNNVDAPFMIEEFLHGPEVDIDLVVQNGVIKFMAVADNFPSQGSACLFMESGGCQPSQLPLEHQEELFEMTRKLVSHFGTDLNGVFHFEAKYTPQGPSPIEMNLRLGGCEVLSLVLAVYGVNLGIQQLKIACGIPVEELNVTPKRICCSTNILAIESGYVEEVGFFPELTVDNSQYMGGMHRCHVGQALKAPPLGFQFCAWMVALGKDFTEAKANIDTVSNGFYINFRPYKVDDVNGRVGGTLEGQYYLEDNERANWKLIKQVGHKLDSYIE